MSYLAIIVVLVLLYVMFAYNGIIKMNNRVKEAWADIDVQLKRRYNLIPNLVSTVKGYANHEESVFTQVTEARNQAINAGNIKDQQAAENMLSGTLKSLFAVAENYPDLKANENFVQLQNELVDTEDKIQSSRRFYNSIVRDFNTKIEQVPTNIIAKIFAFHSQEFFEIEDENQKENVQVSFNDNPSTPPAAATPVASMSNTEAPAPVTPQPATEAQVAPVEPMQDTNQAVIQSTAAPAKPTPTPEQNEMPTEPMPESTPETAVETQPATEEPASSTTVEPESATVANAPNETMADTSAVASAKAETVAVAPSATENLETPNITPENSAQEPVVENPMPPATEVGSTENPATAEQVTPANPEAPVSDAPMNEEKKPEQQ